MIIEIFYIITFIVLFYIYYHYIYIKKSNEGLYKVMNYKFNIGDIILIKYKSILQFINEKFTSYNYFHPCLVIDGANKNIIHILKNGSPIIERINMDFLLNNKILEISILPIKKPIDNTIMKNSYKKFLNYSYNNNKLAYVDYMNNITPNISFHNNPNKNLVICIEFIVLILHDLGLVNNLKCKTHTYNTKDIINLPAYDKNNIKTYLIPSYNFIFGITYLYKKLLEIIPIPKFIER